VLGGVFLRNGTVFESNRLAVDDDKRGLILNAPDRVEHSESAIVRAHFYYPARGWLLDQV
jgi:hypothetical protein